MLSLQQIKLIALGALALVLIYFTVQYERGQFALKENKSLKADITAGNTGNENSLKIGVNLNAGQGQYETDKIKLDAEIPSVGPAHDVDSVRRTQARISAGIAARQRARGVQ